MSQDDIDAKHEKHVKSALRKTSKAQIAATSGTPPGTGACTIAFGGGFKICQDGVTKQACSAVARQMGGTPSFTPRRPVRLRDGGRISPLVPLSLLLRPQLDDDEGSVSLTAVAS